MSPSGIQHTSFLTRVCVVVAVLSVLIAILMDLVAYHVVADKLVDLKAQKMWGKAVFYQAFHGMAILVWALYFTTWSSFRWFGLVPVLWLCGIGLFSGGIYCLLLWGEGVWHKLIPWGGVAYLLGWCLFCGNCFKSRKMN